MTRWSSSDVQSLLFDRDKYTAAKAKHWAEDHGYRFGKVDTTAEHHRLRQFDPDGRPCRTVTFGQGIKAVVCAAGRNPLDPEDQERADARARILADYNAQIVESMARTLWVMAYADWTMEDTEDARAERERIGHVKDWDTAAPDTPSAAEKAAMDLARLIVAQGGISLGELFVMAETADHEEDFEIIPIGQMERWMTRELEYFGHYLAHMSIGDGSSWFDDHAQFELDLPDFECHFDGEDLIWSGKLSASPIEVIPSASGAQATFTSDRIGRIHNLKDSWGPRRFILQLGENLLLINARSLDDALDEAIDWVEENDEDLLVDDQINEEYQRLLAEGVDEQEASEQAEVDTTTGGNHSRHIMSDAWSIVAEDPDDDTVVKIGRNRNPARRARRRPAR